MVEVALVGVLLCGDALLDIADLRVCRHSGCGFGGKAERHGRCRTRAHGSSLYGACLRVASLERVAVTPETHRVGAVT